MCHLPQVVVAASWEDDLQDVPGANPLVQLPGSRKGCFNNYTNRKEEISSKRQLAYFLL